jgi:hypothetical protein
MNTAVEEVKTEETDLSKSMKGALAWTFIWVVIHQLLGIGAMIHQMYALADLVLTVYLVTYGIMFVAFTVAFFAVRKAKMYNWVGTVFSVGLSLVLNEIAQFVLNPF